MLVRFVAAVLAALLTLTATPLAIAGTDPGETGEHSFSVGSVRLWYRVAGRPSGTPVVFLHGGPGEGSQTFARFAGPALEPELRMVYLDERGSGHSDRPKSPDAYSISQMVDDIEALRQYLGAPKFDLIGHSFGTILGLEYAARYPDKVAHLVLAGAVPDMPRLTDILCTRLKLIDSKAYARATHRRAPGAYSRCDALNAYDGPAEGAFFHRNMYPDPNIGRLVDAADNADGLGNSGESSGALIAKGLFNYTFTAQQRVVAPVLIIAGDHDFQAAEAPQRDLAHALPHAQLLVYRGAGHFMFVEDPQRFARDVVGFLLRMAAPKHTIEKSPGIGPSASMSTQ